MNSNNLVMIDLETTGTCPAENHILQIAAVKFNLVERTVSHQFFNRCLLPSPSRYWDESTRDWWLKRKDVLQGIMNRMEDPKTVLESLRDWAGSGAVLVSKPTHFDFSFLDSYYRQYGMQVPFFYRSATDMNSFLRGLYFPETPPEWERILPFEGAAHDALADTLHQVKVLFKATSGE